MNETTHDESENERPDLHVLPPHTSDATGEEGERRMSAIEADRLDLYQEAAKSMTQRAADTLMEHLPPLGWGDVARKSDIVILKSDITNLKSDITNLRSDMSEMRSDITNLKAELKADIQEVKADVNQRIDRLEHGMWAMCGIMAAGFFTSFTMMFVMK